MRSIEAHGLCHAHVHKAPHEVERLCEDAQHLERRWTVLHSIKWSEPESNLIDRARGHGSVFTRLPAVIVEDDAARERLRHPLHGATANQRACCAPKECGRSSERRRVSSAVILGEEAVHRPNAEEKAHFVSDAHDAAPGLRPRFSAVAGAEKAFEEYIARLPGHTDAIRDRVHRTATQEDETRKRIFSEDLEALGENEMIRTVASQNGHCVGAVVPRLGEGCSELVYGVRDVDIRKCAKALGEGELTRTLSSTSWADEDGDAHGVARQLRSFRASCYKESMSASGIANDLVAYLHEAEFGAAWENATDLAVIEARGADREKWLNGLVTCDVAKLETGVVSYGLVVGRTGKMHADMRIVRDDERLLLVVPEVVRADLMATFERHLIMEDVELSESPLHVVLGFGPKSTDRQSVSALGEPVVVASWNRTRHGGSLVLLDEVPKASAVFLSPAACLVIRLRHAIAKWGDDFDTTLYPHEASLEKVAVAFDKGCYLGQEVVCMVELRGQVKRKLVLLEGAASMPRGARIFSSENVDVGEVRSTSTTPDGERAIALVKVAFAADDTQLKIGNGENAGSDARARVLRLCGRV